MPAVEAAASGEYNPLNSGAWNAGRVEAALLADARAVAPAAIDPIMTEQEALDGFWEM